MGIILLAKFKNGHNFAFQNESEHNFACLKMGMFLLAEIENGRYFACQNEKWA